MLEWKIDTDSPVVEITIDGKATKEELHAFVEAIEPLFERHGKLRALEIVHSFRGIEPAALWDDFKFGFRHYRDFSKFAVVSDKRWAEVWTKLAAPIAPGEGRFYPLDQLDAARAWVAEP